MKPTPQRIRAYLLAEVILALVVSAILTAVLIAGLVALIRGLQPPQVAIDGETLPIAPTFGSFPSAVRLHQSLTNHLSSARAVYVFGGRHVSIPADSAAAMVEPLRLRSLPSITDFSAGLPMDTKTFYDRYASVLGDFEPNCSAEDFTLLAVGASTDALVPSCLVQVRHRDLTVTDGGTTTPYIVREVQLWDEAGWQRYAFAERASHSGAIFTGAVHTWFRYSATTAEEGPACAVFPDPWVYAGRRGADDDLPPFSRFAYLIPVTR